MNVTSSEPQRDALLKFATEIVAAYVGSNPVPASELPALIKNVHATLATLDGSQTGDHPTLKPAVPIKKSVTDAYIICLEDGKRLKMLKRYLRTNYNMTPKTIAPNGGYRWTTRWSRLTTPPSVRNLRRRSGLESLTSHARCVAAPEH